MSEWRPDPEPAEPGDSPSPPGGPGYGPPPGPPNYGPPLYPPPGTPAYPPPAGPDYGPPPGGPAAPAAPPGTFAPSAGYGYGPPPAAPAYPPGAGAAYGPPSGPPAYGPPPGPPAYGPPPGAPGYPPAAGAAYGPPPGAPGYPPAAGAAFGPTPGVPGAPGTAAPGIPRWNPPVAGYPVSGRSRKGLWIGLGIGAVCVAGVIIAVVAIPGSNQSGSAGTASPAASSGASSGSSVQPPDGFAYKKLLTGAGVLPAGWKIGGESDSGADASTPNTDDVGISAVSCQDLGVNTASMLLDYQSSYAELNVDSNDGPGDTPDVSLNGFLPGNATKALADVRKLAARCHTFSGDSTSPGTYTTTVAPVSVSGADQALVVEMTTPSGSSDFTDAYWLFAQYGNTIVGADELTWSPSESGDTQHFPSMAASLGNKVGQASANG